MKKVRRMIIAVLIGTLMLGFVACTGANNTQSASEVEQEALDATLDALELE